jgi:hypothetical protein
MLSFIFVIVYSLFSMEANLCRFLYRLCIYALQLAIQLSRKEGWNSVSRVTPAHVCACTMLQPGFSASYVIYDCFVDIGGIDNHHCL